MDWAEFGSHYSVQADAITADPSRHTTLVASKTIFHLYLERLECCPAPSDVPGMHDAFRGAHQGLGPIVANFEPPILGTAMAAQDVVTYLFVSPPATATATSPTYGRSTVGRVGDPAAVDFHFEINEAATIRPDQAFKRDLQYNVWAFHEGTGSAPFSSGTFDRYPCRLGLEQSSAAASGSMYAGAWIGLTVDSGPYLWHSPTFADCSWANLTYWEPMGFTRPVTSTCGAGLQEFVTSGVVLRNVHYHSGPTVARWS